MTKMKFEKDAGKNTCSWCFAKDEYVLYHAKTGTYWHENCAEVAQDVIHHIIDWIPSDKDSRS